MIKYLQQKQWYRRLFDSKTFIYVDGKWKLLKYYQSGEKVTRVEGHRNTQFFCSCGNELVHSQSLTTTYTRPHKSSFEFRCSHCKTWQHARPDIMPGLFRCDSDGNTLTKTYKYNDNM